jgi:carboxypeptidase D
VTSGFEGLEANESACSRLNGGPGCSSLEGLLQENGPFLWQYGTLKPVPNPWTWVNLTNVVWVEQPVGTGFSQGTPEAKSEADVAQEFIGFWRNFVDTFALQNRKIYITGESYAGMYVPHIASAMLDTNNTKYYNLEGTLIYDPSINTDAIMNFVPAPAFVQYWDPLFALNSSFKADIQSRDEKCGLSAYLNTHLTYPPKGKFPPPPSCGGALFNDITVAATDVNPCWDIYQVATTCPLLYDVLGFPGSIPYLPPGGEIYFNRPDVKKAINAPVNTHWHECSEINVFNTSTGLSTDANNGFYSSITVLPGVIERSKRTIIAHGDLDMVLIGNGTLLSIQNMTWNGKQGFQSKPSDPFYVPYHTEYQDTTLAASGTMGTTHTERGLTWVEVNLCGHMEPQYQPSAAFRHMEFLLGRIPSLSSTVPFEQSSDGLEAQQDAPQ